MTENLEVKLRSIQLEDIENCMLLSDAEGWNQTKDDWKRLVENPLNMSLLAEIENQIIGSAIAMNYSNEVVWIGMVLVNKAFRGKGISKMLLSDLLNQLHSCRSVKLDATPAGRPVYEKYGFYDEYIIHRMTNLSMEICQSIKSDIKAEPILSSDIPEVIALDGLFFGAERSLLVKSLIDENPEKCWCVKKDGRITALGLGRRGTRYHHLGPVSATTPEETKVLISHCLMLLVGQPVVLDILSDKKELFDWLESIGFTSQRYFVRMYLGTNPYPGKIENQFLICGPEFG
jgi:GNAT superfamily N-acetyltransferase